MTFGSKESILPQLLQGSELKTKRFRKYIYNNIIAVFERLESVKRTAKIRHWFSDWQTCYHCICARSEYQPVSIKTLWPAGSTLSKLSKHFCWIINCVLGEISSAQLTGWTSEYSINDRTVDVTDFLFISFQKSGVTCEALTWIGIFV